MTILIPLTLVAALAAGDGEVPLPERLALEESEAAAEAEGALPLALSEPQAARPSQRLEASVFAGGVVFEGDFESDPFASGGAMLRLPTPWLFSSRLGLFAEFLVSKMERDLEPPRENMDGVFYGAAFGADFALYRSTTWYLLAQAGTIYLTYGDITGVDDGWGGVGGLVLGLHWIKRDPRYAITINPQWAFDGDDWLLFLHAGLSMRF